MNKRAKKFAKKLTPTEQGILSRLMTLSYYEQSLISDEFISAAGHYEAWSETGDMPLLCALMETLDRNPTVKDWFLVYWEQPND